MSPTGTALLDEIHAKGLSAAQAHFDKLVECMHSVLPDGVKETIPKTLEEVAGLFSASTKEFFLTILPEKPGYESMSVVFCLEDAYTLRPPEIKSRWSLKKFSVLIGGNGMFQAPKEYIAMTIEDALVLSKQIFKYREKYAAENPAISSFPETATTKPN